MKLLKVIFFTPISIIYRFITGLRNLFYNLEFSGSQLYTTPTIVIGNLSVGGTGKTPHIEYLLELLADKYKIATLSRGYGRKTNGFMEVSQGHSFKDVGDEPLQLKHKFSGCTITVDENRGRGIRILTDAYSPKAILLDDAFQHRSVQPGLSVLLTSYRNLFYDDYLLPLGRLRESRSESKRADIIIITKTPKVFSPLEKRSIEAKLNIKEHQKVYFTRIEYEEFRPLYSGLPDLDLKQTLNFILVTGIANTTSLTEYLNSQKCRYEHIKFPDHHAFSKKDITHIKEEYDRMNKKEKFILTTEKDAVRLKEVLGSDELPIYILPIKIKFQENEEEFNAKILEYVGTNN